MCGNEQKTNIKAVLSFKKYIILMNKSRAIVILHNETQSNRIEYNIVIVFEI